MVWRGLDLCGDHDTLLRGVVPAASDLLREGPATPAGQPAGRSGRHGQIRSADLAADLEPTFWKNLARFLLYRHRFYK